MNKYVEKLFNQMSESRDGTTRFYFEQKRYWIINVHRQQLPECEEKALVDTSLPDKERINQLEMLSQINVVPTILCAIKERKK